MIVCAACKKEMKCKKTGSYILFCQGKHVYPADQFECSGCGAIVNVSSGNPFYNHNPLSTPAEKQQHVWMD